MPTYGWGDQFGEFGWGGESSTGDYSYTGNVSCSFSPSHASKIKPVVASSVVFVNSSESFAEYVGSSLAVASFYPSSDRKLSAVYGANAVANFVPSSVNTASPVLSYQSVSFVNSYAKRIRPLVSASVTFTPSNEAHVDVTVNGNISFSCIPNANWKADFKKAGYATAYFFPISVARGWRIRQQKDTLYSCVGKPVSIWNRIDNPSTIFAEV